MLKFIISFLLFVMILGSCKDEIQDHQVLTKDNFQNQTTCGIYSRSETLFAFDENIHQYAFNQSMNSFRIQTDDQSSYLVLRLSKTPKIGDKVILTVQAQGIKTIRTGRFYVEVMRHDSEGTWLWDERHQQGYLLKLF